MLSLLSSQMQDSHSNSVTSVPDGGTERTFDWGLGTPASSHSCCGLARYFATKALVFHLTWDSNNPAVYSGT